MDLGENESSPGEENDERLDNNEFKDAPLPLFSKIRNVLIRDDTTMTCSCCHFESCGLFCIHQVCVSKYVHEQNGVPFLELTHHDIIVRYLSGYMHLAYDESTPKDIRDFYHTLACNDIIGPKLRTSIGDTIPIHQKEIHKDAIDRLKNYHKDDINFNKFDGAHTQTYSLEDEYDQETEEEMLELERKYYYDLTNESIELKFNESINNANIPRSMIAGIHTRDTLKQAWYEACSMADDIGHVATVEFEASLKRFTSFCNAKGAETKDKKECENWKNCTNVTRQIQRYIGFYL